MNRFQIQELKEKVNRSNEVFFVIPSIANEESTKLFDSSSLLPNTISERTGRSVLRKQKTITGSIERSELSE